MNFFSKHKLTVITTVFWFLLLFIIAAWVWWFISLEKQNNQMYYYRLLELKKDDINYAQKVTALENIKHAKTIQYISEGITFVLVTLFGAVFIYRATKRQILFSRQQQNFMMTVTHELKTPIAVTQLNLQTLQKRKLEEAQQQKLIANTLQEANRLNTLTNNILVSSQLETGAYTLNKQEFDVSALLQQSMDEFEQRHNQRRFVSRIESGLYMNGEQSLIQMMINNLLDNAVKYAASNTVITLSAQQQDELLIIQIADEGAGIPADEKNKVFNKFYRVGNEATRTTQGTGLGLFLCKKIVKDHGGMIAVTDNKPQGSIFTISFQST